MKIKWKHRLWISELVVGNDRETTKMMNAHGGRKIINSPRGDLPRQGEDKVRDKVPLTLSADLVRWPCPPMLWHRLVCQNAVFWFLVPLNKNARPISRFRPPCDGKTHFRPPGPCTLPCPHKTKTHTGQNQKNRAWRFPRCDDCSLAKDETHTSKRRGSRQQNVKQGTSKDEIGANKKRGSHQQNVKQGTCKDETGTSKRRGSHQQNVE